MGGRVAPATPAEVARARSAIMRTNVANFGGFGLTLTDVATTGGAFVAGGPAGGAVAIAADLASIFGDGSTRDKQRAARANYFGNLAVNNGNVAAAQIILGALVPNVSGNELPMWQTWLNQLQSSTQGQATLAAARQLGGPYWPVGSSDTVTDYPIMKNFVNTWAAAHPFSSLPASITGPAAAIASSSALPWLLGAGAVVAVLALRRRR